MHKKFYFHHIMKTAGMSVREFLSHHLSGGLKFISVIPNIESRILPVSLYDHDAILALDNVFLENMDDEAFVSHIPFCLLDKYFEKVSFITFLRDPLKRHLSHIRFYRDLNQKDPCLISGLSSSKLQSCETYNFQVLNLTSLDPWDPNIDIRDHLISAKHNLEHKLMYFGFTENLQDCLDLFAKKMDCFFGLKVSHGNKSTDKNIDMSDVDINHLKAMNWADYELYAFAKDLFKKKHPNILSI